MWSWEIIKASQDENRELVSLLAAICAIVIKIQPMLIYEGESRDLQNCWGEDVVMTLFFLQLNLRDEATTVLQESQ